VCKTIRAPQLFLPTPLLKPHLLAKPISNQDHERHTVMLYLAAVLNRHKTVQAGMPVIRMHMVSRNPACCSPTEDSQSPETEQQYLKTSANPDVSKHVITKPLNLSSQSPMQAHVFNQIIQGNAEEGQPSISIRQRTNFSSANIAASSTAESQQGHRDRTVLQSTSISLTHTAGACSKNCMPLQSREET
jgi:hypothetical protein